MLDVVELSSVDRAIYFHDGGNQYDECHVDVILRAVVAVRTMVGVEWLAIGAEVAVTNLAAVTHFLECVAYKIA